MRMPQSTLSRLGMERATAEHERSGRPRKSWVEGIKKAMS